ncbi:hypothetical protein [Luteimonas cucumeris]|uniref:hypothetical protein n=1 Tax=Luteimonas cucumeris TaxID=985012 RepID=UPI0011A5BB0E|nr:hypothetical protein [Luteimonas cucumeris]
MGTEDQESFVRWQGVTRDYFSSVSNLILGLSTGLLAFLVSGLASQQATTTCLLILGTISLVLLAASVVLAVWCAINRLRDFRSTARIARLRSKNEHVPPGDRLETKILGQLSWRLFWWQLVLFGFGAGGVAITVITRLWAQQHAL